MGKLNVWLHDNPLTEDPDDFFGKIKLAGKINNENVAALISKEGTELKPETIFDIITRSDRIKAQFLADGYSVNTPFCNAHPKINGVFNNPTEKFNKEKHRIRASFSEGSLTRNEFNNTKVDILGVAIADPVIGMVIDSLSGIANNTITPNNVIKIQGNRIKVAGPEPGVGVWLINQADNTRTQCPQLILNYPKEILVMVPALPSGEYQLEIVTQYSQGTMLKTPRSANFEHLLIIE